ncbi:unnamed protein product, partial [marine sediment metagenome]
MTEVFEQIRNTSFYIRHARLTNIDLAYLESEYKEFHANYIVLTRINSSIPTETLKWRYYQVSHMIIKLKQNKDEIIKILRQNRKINILGKSVCFFLYHDIILNTFEIYLFSEWNRLIQLFHERGHTYLLYFMSLINEAFQKIADNRSDLDLMHIDLINLGRIINRIDYEKLIFDDIFPDEIQLKSNNLYLHLL